MNNYQEHGDDVLTSICDLSAEQALLGGILSDNEALSVISGFLRPESFHSDNHGTLFRAMLELYREGKVVDTITLKDILAESKKLAFLGSKFDLSILTANPIEHADTLELARKVHNMASLRAIVEVAEKIARTAHESRDASGILATAETEILRIAKKTLEMKTVSVQEVLPRTMKRLADKSDSNANLPGISTGFEQLDHFLEGLRPGTFIVIAGRPGSGAFSFALNILLNVALTDTPVVMFSLLMHHEMLMKRLLTINSGVQSARIHTGYLDDADWLNLYDAADRISNCSLYFDSSATLSPLEISARVKRMKMENGIRCLFIDNLQQIKIKGQLQLPPEQAATEISHSLKELALELGIPIVALSELSPDVDAHDDNRPELSDLLHSGAYEQAADAIILMYRDAYYYDGDMSVTDDVDVKVAINRNGPVGGFALTYHRDCSRFMGYGDDCDGYPEPNADDYHEE